MFEKIIAAWRALTGFANNWRTAREEARLNRDEVKESNNRARLQVAAAAEAEVLRAQAEAQRERAAAEQAKANARERVIRAKAEAARQANQDKLFAKTQRWDLKLLRDEHKRENSRLRAERWAARWAALAAWWNNIRLMPRNPATTASVLAVVFYALTLIGIMVHWAWVWGLFPLLAIWALRARSFAKADKLTSQYFGKMLLPRLSVIWLATYAVCAIHALTR